MGHHQRKGVQGYLENGEGGRRQEQTFVGRFLRNEGKGGGGGRGGGGGSSLRQADDINCSQTNTIGNRLGQKESTIRRTRGQWRFKITSMFNGVHGQQHQPCEGGGEQTEVLRERSDAEALRVSPLRRVRLKIGNVVAFCP